MFGHGHQNIWVLSNSSCTKYCILLTFCGSFQFCPEKLLFCFICPSTVYILSSFHTNLLVVLTIFFFAQCDDHSSGIIMIKTDIKEQTSENLLKAVTSNLELLLCFHLNEKLSCFYISQ